MMTIPFAIVGIVIMGSNIEAGTITFGPKWCNDTNSGEASTEDSLLVFSRDERAHRMLNQRPV